MDVLEKYVSVTPNPQQKSYQDSGFHMFVHFGLNTFADREWGDGTDPASLFAPTALDTDQWARAAVAAGAKGIILTAKHHDGFCLWPTETTEYSVKNSPYRDGKGDVVQEASESCRKYGLKFGIYLSPWDRNCPLYGTEAYNDFYIRQLTELLTGYGEIFCVWLDGACGAGADGKKKTEYDFDRIYETIRRLQPGAVIDNCGPDIRWVGNEGGYARKSEWNVVPSFSADTQTIQENSQQEDGQNMNTKSVSILSEDIGSRQVLAEYRNFVWYPAEVDVSLRRGWFYHKKEDFTLKSLNRLLQIYYASVGGNTLLLLNMSPDQSGRIPQRDFQRLEEFGGQIRKAFAQPAVVRTVRASRNEDGFSLRNMLDREESCYTPADEKKKYTVQMEFSSPQTIDKVFLKEQCRYSQRIERFEVYALCGETRIKVYEGTTVGFGRIAYFKPVTADGIELRILSCRKKPYLQSVIPYQSGGRLPGPDYLRPLLLTGWKLGHVIYTLSENRKNRKMQNG